MPTYTTTAGDQPKLLATTRATTRTATSLRGLDSDEAAAVAAALTRTSLELTLYSADPDFITKMTTLGLRSTQLVDEHGNYTVSNLADAPAPAGQSWTNGPNTPACHIGTVLSACEKLPDAAARGLRAELRTVLAAFDGPVVATTIGFPDTTGTINAAEWVDDAVDDLIGDLLFGNYPDALQAAESALWFYSEPDRACAGLGNELVAADYDIVCEPDLHRVVNRIAHHRPDLLTQLLNEAEANDIAWDDEDLQAHARQVAARTV